MGDPAAGGAFRKFPGAEDPFDSEVEVENCWVKIYQETIHQCGAKSPGGDAIGSEVRATDTTNNLPSNLLAKLIIITPTKYYNYSQELLYHTR